MAKLDIIKAEIDADPLARGYSSMTDQELADDMNTVYRTRNRSTMAGRDVMASVIDAEYDALSDAKKAQFLALVSSADLDPFGMPANVVKDVFGVGSTTVSGLATARVENVSRAEELALGTVRPGTVAQARAL